MLSTVAHAAGGAAPSLLSDYNQIVPLDNQRTLNSRPLDRSAPLPSKFSKTLVWKFKSERKSHCRRIHAECVSQARPVRRGRVCLVVLQITDSLRAFL